MLKVGLTGGICSGKTTVSNIFKDKFHIVIIDADEISRDLLLPNTKSYKEVAALFGKNAIQEDGSLNRKYIRDAIFKDKNLRIQLENIIHPKVENEIIQSSARLTEPYCIISIPLLIEAHMQSLVDRILVIDVSQDIQIQRIQARDQCSREQALSIIESQIPQNERLSFADEVIANNNGIAELHEQITKLHQKYLAICA